MRPRHLVAIITVLSLLFAAAVLVRPPAGETSGPAKVVVDLYTTPACGCCAQYVDYLKGNGFDVTVHRVDDLAPIKERYGVPDTMRSCHTSIVAGYFVEGHVPVEAIHKLLDERPDVKGIALPGMPAGSPGMGGTKAGPFVIYAVTASGIYEFVRV